MIQILDFAKSIAKSIAKIGSMAGSPTTVTAGRRENWKNERITNTAICVERNLKIEERE